MYKILSILVIIVCNLSVFGQDPNVLKHISESIFVLSDKNNITNTIPTKNATTETEYNTSDVAALKAIRDNAPQESSLKKDWAEEGNVGLWSGVKWSETPPRKVTQLLLTSKGLTSLDVTSLSMLESLDCRNNLLTSLKIEQLTKLKDLSCSNNQLDFLNLPLKLPAAGGTYNYSPQNRLFKERSIVAGEMIDYSFEAIISGSPTSFTWYKDQEKILGTNQTGIYIPAQEGFYYCSMTNGLFPSLTLITSNIKVGISEEFQQQDVAALKKIRDNAPLNSSLKNEWINESKIGTWSGVIWTENKPKRVTSLILENKNLTEIDIEPLTYLKDLTCSYNHIPLSKLPLKLPVSGGYYMKFPQSDVFNDQSYSIGETIDYSSEAIIAGKTSLFKWYGCGIEIKEADQSGKYIPTREGIYYCVIYSPYWNNSITTSHVKIGNPPPYDTSNINALIDIREKTKAGSFIRSSWSNINSIQNWHYVIWSSLPSRKVTSLSIFDLDTKDIDLSPLTDLTILNCHGNNLESLNIKGLKNLKTFSCSENKLRFSKILIDTDLSEIQYTRFSPQYSWGEDQSILLGETIDFSSEALVNGIASNYIWFKNNIKIEGTDQSGKYTPLEDGFYYCTVTNSSYPTMVIQSPVVVVGTPSLYDTQDVNALIVIRDQAPADSPLKNLWQDDSLVGSWTGVTWTRRIKPYKVEHLNISSSKITELDVHPFTMLKSLNCDKNSIKRLDLTGMTRLTDIFCRENEISELNLSGIESNIAYMYCSSNRLAFSKLPLLSTRLCKFIYDDQKPYPEDKTISLGSTIDFSAEAKIEKHNTVYAWYRNNVKISGTDQTGKYTPAEDGYYYCTMTNGRFYPLQITSNVFIIGAIEATYSEQDIKALKTIRDDAPSDSPLKTKWNDETKIDTWEGVTWSNEKPFRVISLKVTSSKLTSLDVSKFDLLKEIDCRFNSLTTIKIANLNYLENVYCSSNLLTSIDITGCPKIRSLNLSGNNFTFSSLPPKTKGASYYNNYNYSYQNPYSSIEAITKGETIDFSSQSTINGVPTSYTWYISEFEILDTDQSGKLTTDEDGYYSCVMTNPSFPSLTIKTALIKVGEPEEYSKQDIEALKKIRDNTPVDSYLRRQWADESAIRSWAGVGWRGSSPKRVVSLSLRMGNIDVLEVDDLLYLMVLDCSYNKLKALHVSGKRIKQINCEGNFIPFSKLLIPSSPEVEINYSPQRPIFQERTISLGETIDFSEEAIIEGNPTNFTWYQNGVVIEGTIQGGKYTPQAEDIYYCEMTNSKFPNLKLITNKITVGNPPTYDPVDIAELISIRDKAPANSPLKNYWSDNIEPANWQGVYWTATIPKKVTTLDIANSQLPSLEITRLKLLKTLRCNGNQLTTINISQLPQLQVLDCSNNYLPFSQLLLKLPVSDGYYSYSPQKVLFEEKEIPFGETIDYSSEVLFDGVSTIYTWFKNNEKIENTNQSGKYTPDTEGYYYCTMTNAKFSKLTLTTSIIKVGNPPEFDPQDIIALKNVRAQFISNNNYQTTWKDENRFDSWQGVTWSNMLPKRVTGLYLYNAKLTKLELPEFSNLTSLDCSNNQLSDLDVSMLPNLKVLRCNSNKLNTLILNDLKQLDILDCRYNQLKFSTLPSTLLVKNYSYEYSNQLYLFESSNFVIGSTIDCSSEAIIDGQQTKFLWFKNGVQIDNTDNIGKYTITEDGKYYCSMTNSKFPLLVLQTPAVTVGTVIEFDSADVEVLKSIRDNAPSDSPLKSNWKYDTNTAVWYGITWSSTIPRKVVQLRLPNQKLTQLDVNGLSDLEILDCSNNQLSELSIDNLKKLTALFCRNNQLTSLALKGLEKLNTLNCSGNKISFSKLPLKTPLLSTYTYSPQSPFSENISTELGTEMDLSSEAIINGTQTIFSWYRNNEEIVNTDQSGKFTPNNDGFFYCKMTNPLFPNLTINTGTYKVGSPIEYSPNDIMCLRRIRDISPEDSNIRLSWLDSRPVNTWSGVTWNTKYPKEVKSLNINNLRLTDLDISEFKSLETVNCSNNNLTKFKVSDLINLSTIYCQNNKLESLELANLPKLKTFYCSNNHLPFSQIPLDFLDSGTQIYYSPQGYVFKERLAGIGETIDFSSEKTIGTQETAFQWFKDNKLIDETDQSGKYTPQEDGYYYCQMTNSRIPGLTITTNFIKVGSPFEYDQNDITALKAIRDNAPETSPLKQQWEDNIEVSQWPGITWSVRMPKKVTALKLVKLSLINLDVSALDALMQLDCNNNHLTSIKVSGLQELNYLNCIENNLSEIDISGLKKLYQLYLANNQFKFSKLPVSYNGIISYYPQKNVFEELSCDLGYTIDYSSESYINQYKTQYLWYKNSVKIEQTDQSGKFTPTSVGVYHCVMTNPRYYQLQLLSKNVTINSNLNIDTDDLTFLRRTKDNAPATSALKSDWADESKIETWAGIVWTDTPVKKIKELDISSKELLEVDLSKLTSLEKLNCSNNSISDLNIDNLPISYLNCSNNKLTKIKISKSVEIKDLICNNNSIPFSQLPTRLPVNSGIYKYAPMNKIGPSKKIPIGEQINYILESSISGNPTTFTWYKDNQKLENTDQTGLYIPTSPGDYYCTMTNNLFPDLTIATSTVNVYTQLEHDPIDLQSLQVLRDSAPANSPLRTQWADDKQITSWNGVTWNNQTPKKVKVLQLSNLGLTSLDVSTFSELEQLYCDNNQLIKLKISGLLNLAYISCAYNNLNSINISALPKIQHIFCNNNKLSFSKLPTKLPVSGGNYQYWPQKKIFEEKTIPLNEIIDYSSEAMIEGISTIFTWYKDNEKVTQTDQSGKFRITEDGYYYCVMTNSKFPGLMLTTNNSNSGAIYQFDQRDIAILKTIRNTSHSDASIRTKWANDGDIGYWSGVTWNNSNPRRITELNISNNKLISIEINELEMLQKLDVSNNQLSAIKINGLQNLESINVSNNRLKSMELSNLPKLNLLKCAYNNLKFSDFWTTHTIIINSNAYSPQDVVFDKKNIQIGDTIDYSSEAAFGGIPTTFTWYKNGTKFVSDSSPKFIPSEEGYYYCTMTNSNFPGLILFSDTITVDNPSGYSLQDIATLKDIRNSAPEDSNLKALWTDNLSVEKWEGVSWNDSSPRRIVKLKVSRMKLSKLDITSLTALEGLYCDNNNLKELNLSGLSNLSIVSFTSNRIASIDVQGLQKLRSISLGYNRFPFSKIPQKLSGNTWAIGLDDQIDVFDSKTIILGETIDYSSEAMIRNQPTSFSWYKDGVLVDDSDNSGKYTPKSIGNYYCKMLSKNYPIYVTTSIVKVVESATFDSNDVAILKYIRDTAPTEASIKTKWNNNDDISSWEGIKWGAQFPFRVVSLDVSNNNLTELNVSQLSDLTQLICNNNQLHTINISGLTKLVSLQCSNNNLSTIDLQGCTALSQLFCNNNLFSFSKLPINLPIRNGSYIYAPQKKLFTEREVSTLETIDYSSEAIIDGENTIFTWYYSGSKISSADNSGKHTISANGEYYCEMKNSKFPGLTLQTNILRVNIPTTIHTGDLAALKAIRDNAPSTSPIHSSWKDNNNATSWSGVSWNEESPLRVIELNISGMKLNKLDISQLSFITSLDCSNNQLESLKTSNLTKLTRLNCSQNELRTIDISDLVNLSTLKCNDNYLLFSELPIKLPISDGSYIYWPQKLVFDQQILKANQVIDFSCQAIINNQPTSYEWFKNDTIIKSTDQSGKYIPTKKGSYQCKMSNLIFPNLILTTNKIEIATSLGIDYISDKSLKIFPNPTSGLLYVHFGKQPEKQTTITLMDYTGRCILVKDAKSSVENISLNGLNPGTYLISVKSSNRVEVQKITKK